MRYDVVIIGGGPGGTAAAKILGCAGKRVALVSDELGGECLNYGCIPTKTYLYTAELFEKITEAQTLGITLESPSLNWQRMQERKREVVTKLKKQLNYTLERANVEVIEGLGIIKDPNTIQITSEVSQNLITADYIILAMGSQAAFPTGFTKSEHILSNREIIDIPEIPKSLLIIGGGAVGVEFASIFAALGTKVTIAEASERLLTSEDHEVSAELERVFLRKNISILKNTRVEPARTNDFDKVLIATGRKPKIEGLETLGITIGTNGVKINEFYQTNIPNIFVIGDLAGKALLAYTAEREGEIAAEFILGKHPEPLRYEYVPNTIFSIPEVASVGLPEFEIKKRSIPYVIGKSLYSANAKALILGSRDGFAKILAERNSGKLLGIHIIGAKATELIAQASIALQKNLTLEEISGNLYGHPILGEVLKEAAINALQNS